jgi:hypothetical protein
MSRHTVSARRAGSRAPRRFYALVGPTLLAAAGLCSLGRPATEVGAAAQTWTRAIVLATPASSSAAAARVRGLGGRLSRDLPLVGGFAATVPSRDLAALSADRAVRSVTPDQPIRMASALDAVDSAGT